MSKSLRAIFNGVSGNVYLFYLFLLVTIEKCGFLEFVKISSPKNRLFRQFEVFFLNV